MKKIAAFAALAGMCFSAHALPARYFYETQALTRAAPTLSTEGMGLDGVKGYRVSVCAESGQTLTGSGYLRAWLYHIDAALWMRDPSLDLAVTVTGARCQAFPDFETGTDVQHRVLFADDGLGVSAGTTGTVRIDGPRI